MEEPVRVIIQVFDHYGARIHDLTNCLRQQLLQTMQRTLCRGSDKSFVNISAGTATFDDLILAANLVIIASLSLDSQWYSSSFACATLPCPQVNTCKKELSCIGAQSALQVRQTLNLEAHRTPSLASFQMLWATIMRCLSTWQIRAKWDIHLLRL